jgi:hypothetical protein
MKRKLTPQQKKKNSYEKDGRNSWGEHSTARKVIRKHKRNVIRSNRRSARTLIAAQQGDGEASELAGIEIEARRPKRWDKLPDVPLGEFVSGRLERRSRTGMTKRRKK